MVKDDPVSLLPWEQEENNSLLVKLAYINIRREIETTMRPFGVTPQQSQSLYLLLMKPGSMNADLEKLLFIDKSSVTSLINGMVKKGWVVRQDHEKDARMKRIYLTAEGKELCERCSSAIEQVKNKANEVLTDEETETLQVLLKKIIKAYE